MQRKHLLPPKRKFKLKSLKNFEIADNVDTIKCTESAGLIKTGLNPNLTGVKIKIEEWENTFCKNSANEACILQTGTGTGLPWNGTITWTKPGTTGTNGFMTLGTVNITATCGPNECNYEGGSLSKTMPGGIFNANDTNKPVPANERAQLQFASAPMTSSIACGGGTVVAKGVYEIVPNEAARNMYVAMQ